MKINLKCGGRNFRLHQTIDHFAKLASIRNRTCIFFGADVTHPDQSDPESPSIAAVVASNDWPDSGRFYARHRAQKRNTEIIENLQDMVFDLLTEWHRANQHGLPEVMHPWVQKILFLTSLEQSDIIDYSATIRHSECQTMAPKTYACKPILKKYGE
jgi:hypothetical protein